MKIGEKGLALVKQFEGYHTELPDGSCAAYQETINGKPDKVTIGWGCTRGVKMGMVWTREQAEAALLAELESHAKRVDLLATVPLNEHQRDALISFDYNTGGLTLDDGSPSGLLKAVNAKGDVPAEFNRWVNVNSKPVKGLQARRAAEIALWLMPVDSVAPSYMPQAAAPTAKPIPKEAVAAGAAVATGAVSNADVIVKSLTEWQAAGTKLLALATVPSLIVVGLGCVSFLAATYVLPKVGIGAKK